MVDPEAKVRDILKGKRGSIKNAALPQGSPTWVDVQDLTWEEVEDGASQGKTGFRTIKKLLSDSRFDK